MVAIPAVRLAVHLAAFMMLLALTSCRTLPPPVGIDLGLALDWPARRALLQQLRAYECAGRVAVAAAGAGFNAQFSWRQSGDAAQLTLRGPLGTGGMEVRIAGDAVSMTLADGRRLDGEAARAELERTIGAAIPVRALGYWLLGVPMPAAEYQETLATRPPDPTDHPAQLAVLEQQNWRVQYLVHAGLPRQLTLTGGASRVRLVVERYDWASESSSR